MRSKHFVGISLSDCAILHACRHPQKSAAIACIVSTNAVTEMLLLLLRPSSLFLVITDTCHPIGIVGASQCIAIMLSDNIIQLRHDTCSLVPNSD
jgi:hypothetical protein